MNLNAANQWLGSYSLNKLLFKTMGDFYFLNEIFSALSSIVKLTDSNPNMPVSRAEFNMNRKKANN